MNRLCPKQPMNRFADGLLPASDPGLARFYFFQGFLATFAVLYPYFGRVLSLFGYHNRVVSATLILIVIVASIPRFSYGRARNGLAALTLALLTIAYLYADPSQRGAIFHIQFETGYYEAKLARLFQIALPVFLLGYVVSSSRSRASFLQGVWWAIFVSGLIGLCILLTYRQFFLGQTVEIGLSFYEEDLFSTIGMSFVLSLATILILDKVPWKGRDFLWLPWLSLVLFFSVLLLRQRAHLIMLCLFVLARFWGKRRKFVSLVAVALVFGVGAGMVIKHYRDLVITETVQLYWNAAADGRMVRSRTDLAAVAIAGIRENPLGHGLGSFRLHHHKAYPHNRFLEAFYELGILGAVCVGWMCVMGVRRLRGLLFARHGPRSTPSVWFLHAAVVFVLGHELKSGSLECISTYVYFLFIAPAAGRLFQPSSPTSVHSVAHPPGMHRRSARPQPVALLPATERSRRPL